eukprot:1159242-Pelagomonas_calceolata.AAC.10
MLSETRDKRVQEGSAVVVACTSAKSVTLKVHLELASLLLLCPISLPSDASNMCAWTEHV